jgi:hypothetical protein
MAAVVGKSNKERVATAANCNLYDGISREDMIFQEIFLLKNIA